MTATKRTVAAPSVAIVGAGVCGLGIGWRLAQAGAAVTVFDKGEAAHGATWAAAGMLAGGVETEPGEEPLLALAREAQRRWPGFSREIEDATGRTVGYRDEGTIVAAPTRDDLARLRHSYDFQTGLGIELDWLTPAEARAFEPYLRPGLAGAVRSPHDHQVDNRLLGTALADAFAEAGGTLRERTEVEEIVVEAGRATGVRVDGRVQRADIVVLAAGAWSRRVPGLPDDALPPVRPLKGQALALRMDPAEPILRHVLWAPGIYLVPRTDGRLLIGATVEEKGFDDSLTAGGVFALIEAAWRALPAVEELPIDEMWVGFRPGSRDDAPILGTGSVDGLVLATGHHRNGILLAPVTADLVAELILTGESDPALAPFAPGRFARKEAAA